MAETTPNLELIKPLRNEYYDIGIQNENMDIIDRKFGDVEESIESISYPVSSVNGQIGDVQLTAEDIGALGVNEASKDSEKLGGHEPEYYAKQVDLEENLNKINILSDEFTTFSSKIETKIKNEWLKSLSGKNFIAHKGFHAVLDSESSANGSEIPNSAGSFEAAGKLGYKIIELDIQILGDGTWVVSHDNYTSAMLDGPRTDLDTMTLTEFKSRNLYRVYTADATHWIFSKQLRNYKPITFEEALLIAKKYNMFIMPEIKEPATHVYNDTDWENYADIIKRTGMEEKLFLYASQKEYIAKLMNLLPNAIATMPLHANDVDCKFITSYKNHFVLISKQHMSDPVRLHYLEKYNLPYGIWTVNSYQEANEFFEGGANFILTDWLLNNPSLSNYRNILKLVDSISGLSDVKGSGSFNYDVEYLTSAFTTTDYIAKHMTIPALSLKRGDIIRIKASGRTISQTNNNFARMYVSNLKSGFAKKELVEIFKNPTYETREIYYTVPDVPQDITISFGLEGQGIEGTASAEFRNINVEWYTNRNDILESNQRYGSFYSYSSGVYLRANSANFGIKSAYKDPNDSKLLVIEYEPFTNFRGSPIVTVTINDYNEGENNKEALKRHVVPVADNTDNGKVRLKIYDSNWNQLEDAGTNLKMGFFIKILN